MDEEQKITIYESDLYETVEVREQSRPLIVFRIASEWYGVDMTKIREIVKIDHVTYLPSAPPHVMGIFSLRGNILSITDLKNIFGLDPEAVTAKSKLVIVKSGIRETGLLADEVSEPMDVPLSKIDPPLATMAPEQSDYIEGQCKMDDKLIGILRVEKILES